MNSILKIAAFAAVLSATQVVSAAEDYVMYWQITSDSVSSITGVDQSKLTLAKLMVQLDGGGKVEFAEVELPGAYDYRDNSLFMEGTIGIAGTGNGFGRADRAAITTEAWASLAKSSFYVELYNSSGLAATSSLIGFQALIAQDVFDTYDGKYQTSASNAYLASGYSANVPEPTSALLVLLGFAGLALKRKRA